MGKLRSGDNLMGQPIKLGQNDFEAVYDLYRYAFHKEPRGGKDALRYFFGQTIAYGEFDAQQLTSQVTQIPFQVNWGEQLLNANGIGNVSSYPEYRGDGAASRIMMVALQEAYERGDILSYLAPFSYGFYGRFGYAQAFDRLHLSWSAEHFPQGKRRGGTITRMAFDEAQALMDAVYERAPQMKRGGIERENWWWDYYFMMKTPHTQVAIYRDDDHETQGYVMYEFVGETFKIREWDTLTTDALLSTTRFIGSHAGAFSRFEYEAPVSDLNELPVLQLMPEPQYEARVVPYMQARIVNLPAFVQALDIMLPTEVVFNVTDETAPWNGGRFELRGGELTRVVQSEAPAITGSIQAFTQWLMGYRSLDNLLLTGDLTTADAKTFSLLQAQLPKQKPVLADYF